MKRQRGQRRAIAFASILCTLTSPLLAQRGTALEPVTEGWPGNGGNLANHNYSPLQQIDTGNVSRMRGIWLTHLRGSGVGPQYSGAAQPVVG